MSIIRGDKIIAGVPIIDGTMNTASTRPLQNKVITNAINDINGRIDQITGGQIYTKTETDALLADKADKSTTYTKTEVDNLFATLYPVGSIYIGTQSTCPLATIITGSTWSLVSQDRSLQGSSTNHSANTTINAGLPNITGAWNQGITHYNGTTVSGAIAKVGKAAEASVSGAQYPSGFDFDASRSSAIYGASTTVQPPAYVVNVWRRTA